MNNKRAKQIIEVLQNEKTTIRQLAIICDCSSKTVQNDIESINAIFKQNNYSSNIISIPGQGLSLQKKENEDLLKLFEEDDMRNIQILKTAYYLLNNEYVKVDKLVDEFNYSKTTITEILHDLRKLLEKYSLTIETRPHYGMYLHGSESDKRRFILENIINNDDELINKITNKENTYKGLNERIVVLIKDYQLLMSDNTLTQLLNLADLAANRINRAYELENIETKNDKNSFEYIFAKKVVDEISSYLNKDIDENEIKFILNFIDGKVSRKNNLENKIEDNEHINKLINDILMMIKDKYGYDFTSDITLFTSLSIHIQALMKRADNEFLSINPIKDEIKNSYPLAFDMATDASLLLSKRFGIVLDEHEISYIAVYLHLASERKGSNKHSLKKLLVVCPAGKSISQLIAHNIEQQFKDYIESLDTCSYYELEDIDFENYDYIFTYKPLDKQVPLPVIEFPLSSNKQDIDMAKRKLAGKNDLRPALLELTPRELFFNDIEEDNRDSLLAQMIERVNKYIPLPDDFKAAVDEREKVYATELENGYAFPHPLKVDGVDRSFLSFTVLNKPLIWKNKRVRVVMLGYVRDGESIDLQHFYRSFAKLVSRKEYVVRLVESPQYETLLEIAREIQDIHHLLCLGNLSIIVWGIVLPNRCY